MPSPRNVPIDHFVILMMENRSFDHYFGWAGDVADAVQHQTFETPEGKKVDTYSATDSLHRPWQGCGHPDPGHGWDSGRRQMLGGFLAEKSGNDEFALSYYEEGELGFIHGAAREYTLFDRYFCSLMASTWPNRYYKWSAQSGGRKTNAPPVDGQGVGNQWETIFDRGLKKGLTVGYYFNDLPFAAVWGVRGVPWIRPMAQYYVDAAQGTLPNIAIVDPPFVDGGGGQGLSADEHPLGDVRLGQAFMADVANAFVESPNYRRGAMFLIYDEWGGFFDHVTPPSVPDDRGTKDLNTDFGQMGFRIPAVAISPWTRNRRDERSSRVDHGLYGHESVLKFIEYRFGLGNLCKRDARANNIGRAFNWRAKPDLSPPDLPHPKSVAGGLCNRGGHAYKRPMVDDPGAAHENDLAGLGELAEQVGMPVHSATYSSTFRLPDSVRKAFEAGGG
jgi:phospholipase C